jgi:hypothetical protein
LTTSTVYQVTDNSGNVIPQATPYYTAGTNCVPSFNVCFWTLTTKFGTPTIVYSIFLTAPGPACPSGTTADSASGYTRPSTATCMIDVIPSAYGQPPPPPAASTISFSPATYSVLEANTSVTVTVTRTNGIDGAASVSYATSGGTATAMTQYTPTSGTLSWAAGDPSSRTFAVPIIYAGIWEVSDTVNLVLSNPTGTTTPVLGTSTAIITIMDSEPGVLQFNQSSYSVNETGGSITLSVVRSSGAYGAASLNYATANGTAVAGTDYTAASGTLSWANGDMSTKNITVPIINGGVFGPNKAFTVNLSGASGAPLGTASATVNIVDNNPVVPPSVPANLTAGTVTVTQAAFTWSASTDAGGPGLGGYFVFRNGTQVGTVTTTSYNDSGFTPGSGATYSYTVAAFDTAGNTSAQSAVLSITPPSTYQITDASGNVLTAAASLYAVTKTCSTVLQACALLLKTTYGTPITVYGFTDHNTANVCPDASGAVFNVTAVAGYTQPSNTSCIITATPAVYGH